jgi:GDSL-like Lipase/Acylhydrolase family
MANAWRMWCGVGMMALAAVGCNLSGQSDPAPTLTPKAVSMVLPNQSPVPSPTPSITPTSTETPLPTATHTPTPSLTLTPSITPTPSITLTPSKTFTPTITPTFAPIGSKVCDTCKVRLRTAPGTAGRILGWLEETVTFNALGRTEDSTWIEVELTNDPKKRKGWLFRDLTALRGQDVSTLPVTGAAEDLPTPRPEILRAANAIGGVTARSREIFVQGQAMGNKANVFTRVGDSITAAGYFLNDLDGRYDLGAFNNELEGARNFFAGSFSHVSMAAGNGWGADTILTPRDPNCGQDAPIACEYRRVKPAVALIMIGTNDSGGVDPAIYEANLRRIVEVTIEMGVIPVLSTIPPKKNNAWNGERAVLWNEIIRRIAAEYDIPLMDYYNALQGLPNQGLSPDGIHPNMPPDGNSGKFTPENLQYGFTVRNLLALQMLNAIWRNVMY